jgi:hypothetical protein
VSSGIVRGNVRGSSPFRKLKKSIYQSVGEFLREYRKSPGGRLRVPRGRHTYGPEPEIIGYPELGLGSRIGSFCSIAPGTRFIFLGKHHYDWASTYPFYEFYEEWGVDTEWYESGRPVLSKWWPYPIIVGNDVWIASEVSVKQGVRIGDGAVIAFGSLVTHDVPPYALVGGCPAKVIGYRFSPEQIERLLHIAWWNWEDTRIKLALPRLLTSDIDGFIDYAETPP